MKELKCCICRTTKDVRGCTRIYDERVGNVFQALCIKHERFYASIGNKIYGLSYEGV